MATITSKTGARSWGTATDWVGDVAPVDGDAVVIDANCQMLMNADLSAFTGLQTVTISGHATTPGMLYFKNATSGYLKIRTAYNLVGTTGAAKGRLLANSDGVWGNTGALAFADKAVIDLGATSKIDAQYLDIALYCTQPTTWSVRTYGTKYDFTASGTTVDVANNTIDLGVAPPAAGTAVMITTAAGALPGGLLENYVYYVRAVSGNTCKLATQNADANIVDITSTGSGSCSLFTGHTNTATATMNVLDDVTGDAAWVTTDGHDRVVLADVGAPETYDQQRLQLTTINAGSIVLSANVDSVQYPGARIFLISRNVSIRSACVTAVNIVDYASATTSSGVFQCEINSTAGTGTTFYGNGVNSGTGHTISGTVSGCSNGVYSGTGHTISGTVSGCSNGVNSGTRHTISGTVSGCSNGVYYGTGHTISGTASGCSSGVNYGTGHTISGTASGCAYGVNSGTGHTISGTVSGCSNGVYYGTGHTISGTASGCSTTFRFNAGVDPAGLIIRVLPLASIPSPTYANRNTAGCGKLGGKQGIYYEDYNRSLGASLATLMMGDVIKNTSVVRGGGAASSLEVVPQSLCAIGSEIPIFEWTELSVPASAQNKSVYIRADSAFAVYPTAGQLYVEAEYISNATTFATSVVTSTAVLSDGSTWVQFTIPQFTPAVAGHVRYRAYLGWYESGKKIYVDNMLVAA